MSRFLRDEKTWLVANILCFIDAAVLISDIWCAELVCCLLVPICLPRFQSQEFLHFTICEAAPFWYI